MFKTHIVSLIVIFENYMRWISASIILLLAGSISFSAILRYTGKGGVPGLNELGELIIPGIVFFALAWTQSKKGHISIDILKPRLRVRYAIILSIFTSLLIVIVFSAMAWVTGVVAWKSWQTKEFSSGLIPWPMYPVKFMISLGCLVFCFRLVIDLAQSLTQLRTYWGKT